MACRWDVRRDPFSVNHAFVVTARRHTDRPLVVVPSTSDPSASSIAARLPSSPRRSVDGMLSTKRSTVPRTSRTRPIPSLNTRCFAHEVRLSVRIHANSSSRRSVSPGRKCQFCEDGMSLPSSISRVFGVIWRSRAHTTRQERCLP